MGRFESQDCWWKPGRGSGSWGLRPGSLLAVAVAAGRDGCPQGDYNPLCLWPFSTTALRRAHRAGDAPKQGVFYVFVVLLVIISSRRPEWENNNYFYHNKPEPNDSSALEERERERHKRRLARENCCLFVPALSEINKLFKVIRKKHHCQLAATRSENTPSFAATSWRGGSKLLPSLLF